MVVNNYHFFIEFVVIISDHDVEQSLSLSLSHSRSPVRVQYTQSNRLAPDKLSVNLNCVFVNYSDCMYIVGSVRDFDIPIDGDVARAASSILHAVAFWANI